jgi:hypothetical protein
VRDPGAASGPDRASPASGDVDRPEGAQGAITPESVEVRPPPPPPPPAPPATASGAARPKQTLQIADDLEERADARGAGASMVDSGVSGTAVRAPGSARPRGPTVGQLAKQSETAAARGDCAAVRAIVSRLRKLDAAFHKDHVERNAAVKRCVK